MHAIQHHSAETIAIVTPVCDSQILRGWVVDSDRSRRSFCTDYPMSKSNPASFWMAAQMQTKLDVGRGCQHGKTRIMNTGGGLQRRIEVRAD